MIRWKVKVIYRTDDGPLDVDHDLEELSYLHDLVERGPHWDTIVRIEITRINHSEAVDLTVEGAKKL